ncbi:class II aldolase/adducin family protein [Patescibacteria group bacterium]
MAEEYTGVKFEAKKLREFKPTDEEKTNIGKLVSLQEVYRQHKFLDRNGGNFSFRTEKGFIIKRTGVWVNKVSNADFVRVVDVKGGQVFYEGEGKPSSECRTHFLIYSKEPAVHFIMHAHAYDVSERTELSSQPCWVPELSYGTMELAEAVARLTTTCSFVIAQGHGIFAWGPTFAETLKILLDNYAKYRPV